MAYNQQLAQRVRIFLLKIPGQKVAEKKMFGGLAFIVNGKMCINVSGENLMCRFDPGIENEVMQKKGYLPVIMRGKTYKGYCYVKEPGFKSNPDFEYWISLCLDFNKKVKSR